MCLANLADRSFDTIYVETAGLYVLQEIPCDERYDDGHIVTAPVPSDRPNAWRLFDVRQ